MAGSRKHGSHKVNLAIAAAAAGSANDTVGDTWIYDAFADGGATAAGFSVPYDSSGYSLVEASYSAYATLTGQATNFVSPRLSHYSAAGVLKNQISVAHSGTGVVSTAQVPVNLNVASGAVATGAGTGTLTVGTGTALPWALVPGDQIVFDRVSNNGTGLATPGISCTFVVAATGS